MNILTLNLHCFAEENIQQNQQIIANFIADNDVDVVFFQEVGQPVDGDILYGDVKVGNYAQTVKELLAEYHSYDLYYKISNRAFGTYDEGLAILTKQTQQNQRYFYVSNTVDYEDWHTRIIVASDIVVNGEVVSLYSTHLGWTEGDEVFENQVDRLFSQTNPSTIQLYAGDFNVPSISKEYQYIIDQSMYDLFYSGNIDYFYTPTHISDMDVQVGENRIDYVFSNQPLLVTKRDVVFTEPKVSDHYGVFISLKVGEIK